MTRVTLLFAHDRDDDLDDLRAVLADLGVHQVLAVGQIAQRGGLADDHLVEGQIRVDHERGDLALPGQLDPERLQLFTDARFGLGIHALLGLLVRLIAPSRTPVGRVEGLALVMDLPPPARLDRG